MASRTVRTEAELKKALEAKVDEIIIVDKDLIQKVHKARKIKNASATAIAIAVSLIIAAIAAAPVTGGMSIPFTAHFVATVTTASGGLSAGAIVSIVAIAALGTVAIIALLKDYEEIDLSLEPPRLKLKKKQTA